MELNSLKSIGPIDGRYRSKLNEIGEYFSEFALIKHRVHIEVEYFIALCQIPLEQLKGIDENQFEKLRKLVGNFSLPDAEAIKDIEKTTNHDVKAVEYFIKEKMDEFGLGKFKEFVHFGLTSQDINNTAQPLMFMKALGDHYQERIKELFDLMEKLTEKWRNIPMLAKTHGQPASPTLLGKEFQVFLERMKVQLKPLQAIPHTAKFGGATGNMNAHYVAYPDIDWHTFADDFVKKLGLSRSYPTTQIEHYDNLAAQFDGLKRINTILIDLCRDVWMYISMGYFSQKINKNEVGSSAMPHKVNPIDFENAEGNLGIANALFEHLSAKLPISRLQRDLTDSTVMRNIGIPFAHTILAMKSTKKGLEKLMVDRAVIEEDLNKNCIVIAEAVQSILRREGYPKPYEALKELTRNNEDITLKILHDFIRSLHISEKVKEELLGITPSNYTGKFIS